MIKKFARKMIYRFAGNDLDALLAQTEGASVVSFDVFDTLLKRDVAAPEDVFAVIERKLKDSKQFDMDNFAALRMKAERMARQEHAGREITLTEIYSHMPVDDVQRAQLVQTELQTEIELSTPNIPMKQVYDHCVSHKKTVYFISDMYLPADTVQQMLEKSGYARGKLFVSSESGMTKRGGKLFRHVQQTENLKFHDWVHIGDSISSDFITPKKLGIRSLLIDRAPRYNKYYDRRLRKKNDGYTQLNHFIDTRICRYTDPYEQIGYAVLGPLLYGFACWLEREIPRDEGIVFLARDGALLKKAFEVISNRSSIYLRISRRAANVAQLKQVQNAQEAAQNVIHMSASLCAQGRFARNCGLSDNETHRIFKDKNLSEDTIIRSSDAKLKLFTIIWPAVKEKAAEQHDLLQRYFEQLNCTEKCAIVDIGWQGTTQALLTASNYRIAGQAMRWNGFYIGTWLKKDDPFCKTIERHGYLFEEALPKRHYESIINSIAFFELLFLSTDGSTDGYAKGEYGETIPILSKPENDANISAVIASMQNTGLQFVKDIHHSCVRLLAKQNAEIMAGNYMALARVPSLSTLGLFCDFKFHDGHTTSLASEHGLGYYMLHPKQFLLDFADNGSKAWFLKSIFKLPLPYISMLNLMRKLLK